MKALEKLVSVLCGPDGKCCIRGSECDRAVVNRALDELRAATSASQEGDAKDAERYRWLRMQDWFDGEICVLRDPKKVLTSGKGLGADCPSRERLDTFVDEAIASQKATK